MYGSLIPVVSVVLGVFGLFLVLRSLIKLYVKVPPNKAAVFYGRKSKTADGKIVGAKIVSGGGKVRIPFVQAVDWMDLGVMSIELDVQNIPNINGVLVSVKGIANVKIKSDEIALSDAAERFLGMKPQEIKAVVLENLLGNLRAILGKMTIEELIRDRQKFNEAVLNEAVEDLSKMGIQVDLLKIQDIKDDRGYIDALGKPKTAEVKRDAQIAEAERKSEGDQKSAVAIQQAKTVEAEAAADIALAERDRDKKKAEYAAEVNAAQAKAGQAGPLAEAEAKKAVTTKQKELAEIEAERKESELKATIIKPAEAGRQKAIIDAEALKQSAILDAEGKKEKERLEGEGEGLKAQAKGEGEAAGIKAKLLAEAEGISKKAEAMAKLDVSGRILLILEKLPEVLKELTPIAAALAAPMGEIDEVKIIDFGGEGKGPAKFAGNVTSFVTSIMEQFKTMGINFDSVKEALIKGSVKTETKESETK